MTTLIAESAAVEPGVYDIPEDRYHADPVPGGSLSSSDTKLLLAPSCPAIYRHQKDHGRPNKPEWDFGHVAHKIALGRGADIVVVDADDWRKKDSQKQRDDAYAAGKVPILRQDFELAQGMAAAICRHPEASRLLDLAYGVAEHSILWRDRPTGVWRRCRLDLMRYTTAPGRVAAVDLKTTNNANPDELSRSIYKWGYHRQAPWYLDGMRSAGLADETSEFVFVFVEKAPPHIITCVRLDATAMRIGREQNREAIELYAQCMERDEWPSYTSGITTIGLPGWVEASYREIW